MQDIALKQVITLNETEEILKAIDEPHPKLAIALVIYAGLRVSEVFRIKKSDFDMENNEIRIYSEINRYRTVPISKVLKKYLENYFSFIEVDPKIFLTGES